MSFLVKHGGVRSVSLLPTLVLFTAGLHGQYRFDSWTTDNGLPQNSIWGMTQTRDGYLWLTTSVGLLRFDGVHFYTFSSVNVPQITSNEFSAYSLLEDRDGGLWAGTKTGGAIRYHKGLFTSYTTADGLSDNNVIRIDEDPEGKIWIFTSRGLAQWKDGHVERVAPKVGSPFNDFLNAPKNVGVDGRSFGLWRRDSAGWLRFAYGKWTRLPLPCHLSNPAKLRIDSIIEDSQRRLWFNLFDRPGESYQIRDGNLTVFKGLPLEAFVCYQDREGYLWLKVRNAPSNALWKNGRLAPLPGFFTPSVFRALVDRDGGLWFGTKNEGLYHARRQVIQVLSLSGGPESGDVHSILKDRAGDIWFASSGLVRLRGGKFERFYRPGRRWQSSNIIWAIHEDRDGAIWAASWDGIARFKDGILVEEKELSAQINGRIDVIHRDRAGNLWFGSDEGLYRVQEGSVIRYTTADGLADNRVRTILEDRKGRLLIGTNGGVCHFANNGCTALNSGAKPLAGHVASIYEDATGILWIGTDDGGLNRWQEGIVTRYTIEQGLFSNTVSGILEDDRGFLWMSSGLGLFCVRKQQLNDFAAGRTSFITSTHFGKADGLLSVDCLSEGQPGGFKDQDGKLWFVTRNGVAVADPKALRLNPNPPAVVIEECLLEGHSVGCQSGLQMRPDQPNLEVRYTGLSYVNSSQVRFRYQLAGLDTDWIDAGVRRKAYYSHVPPGDYVFRVIAANSDGVWNMAGASLPVSVLPPFYRTWWFVAFGLFSTIGLIWLAWQQRLAQLQRAQVAQQLFSGQLIASQERERKRIAAELHDSLGQSLVVIKNLALMSLHTLAQQEESRQQVEQISDVASQAIGEVKEISYNLRPYQLDRLGLTKAVETVVRTGAAASTVAITSELANIDGVFPQETEINFYRIVQESLNNIVRHSQATQAKVTVEYTEERLRLTIRDNGRGFVSSPGSPGLGFGLTGIAERAKLLGAEAVIQSAPEQGTLIVVEWNTEGLRHLALNHEQ